MLKYAAITLMLVSVIELQLLNIREYEYVAELKNWTQAYEYCHEKGMELLDINSDEEYNKILIAIKSQSDKCVWTSGNDIEDENTWVWKSTGEKITNTHWGRGNPDNYLENEDCLQLRAGSFYYNDIHCYAKCHFMCEKKSKTIRWITELN